MIGKMSDRLEYITPALLLHKFLLFLGNLGWLTQSIRETRGNYNKMNFLFGAANPNALIEGV